MFRWRSGWRERENCSDRFDGSQPVFLAAFSRRRKLNGREVGYMEKPEIALPTPGLAEAVNERLPLGTPENSVNPMQIWLTAGAYLWLLGVLSMAVYSVISLVRLRRRLKDAVREKENIYRLRGSGFEFGDSYFRLKFLQFRQQDRKIS